MSTLPILKGLKVVDLGVGMSAALVAKHLIELGAEVYRFEPSAAGDPFTELYPAYDIWRQGSRASGIQGSAAEAKALDEADVCLMGGEDHPAIPRRADAGAVARGRPRLVVLNIEGYPAALEGSVRPACEVLVQARSGLTFEHYSDRPNLMSFSPANYGAAMRALAGLLVALFERERSGQGQVVATSLLEGAWGWVASLWMMAEKPNQRVNFVIPMDPHPLIFRCSDGDHVHLVIGGAGSKYLMYQALEIDDPTVLPGDSGVPDPRSDPRNFFGDVDVLAAHVAKKPSREILERVWSRGLPAELVGRPGACWDDPQIVHNGLIATAANGVRHIGHPVSYRANPAHAAEPGPADMPLAGLRVVDMGIFVAGPYASVLLADFGAEVIKIESPSGDPNRSTFRSFSAANRGKRSVVLDLKKTEDFETALAICASSDVVTSNFRSGVSQRLGLDPDALHGLRPDLIVLESPAYGSSGPLKDRSGFDMVMQALCGHEFRAAGVGNPPLWNRTSMVDYQNGFLGLIGMLAALYHRIRTGEGATVENTLLTGGLYLCSDIIRRLDGTFDGAEPLNAAQSGFKSSEALYPCMDGWLAICARGVEAGEGLARVLGLESQLAKDPAKWDASAYDTIASVTRPHELSALAKKLEAAGVWTERCRREPSQAVLNDPVMLAAGIVQETIHPEFGQIRELGAMMRFSRSRIGHQRPTPMLNEHSDEIRQKLA